MNTPDRPMGNEEAGLERRLAGWTPAANPSGRDQMLFEAGAASAGGSRHRWPTAALAATAVCLGGWAAFERAERQGLELAFAERTRDLELALARGDDRRPSPATPQVEPPLLSEPTPSRRVPIFNPDDSGLAATSPLYTTQPASLGRVFTPLSSRDPGDLAGL